MQKEFIRRKWQHKELWKSIKLINYVLGSDRETTITIKKYF